jgi:hypothetical protein
LPESNPGEEEVIIGNWRAVVHPRRAVAPTTPAKSATDAQHHAIVGSTPPQDSNESSGESTLQIVNKRLPGKTLWRNDQGSHSLQGRDLR